MGCLIENFFKDIVHPNYPKTVKVRLVLKYKNFNIKISSIYFINQKYQSRADLMFNFIRYHLYLSTQNELRKICGYKELALEYKILAAPTY